MRLAVLQISFGSKMTRSNESSTGEMHMCEHEHTHTHKHTHTHTHTHTHSGNIMERKVKIKRH